MGMNRHAAAKRLAALAIAAGLAAPAAGAGTNGGHPSYNQYRSRTTIPMGTTVRNFLPQVSPGGHPDFARLPQNGSGRYARVAAPYLDAEFKPVFATSGFRVLTDWKDGAARSILNTKPYIDARPGDTQGVLSNTPGGAVLSAASFSSWYRSVTGLNTTSRGELTLAFEPANSVYAFDGTLDTFGGATDFTYTVELQAPFIWEAGKGWYLSTATNGDVFVFVDGRMVIESICGVPPYAALAVNDRIQMANSASIVGLGGVPVSVASNTVTGANIAMSGTASIQGDLMCGPGGNPAAVITTKGTASVTGSTGTLTAPIPMPSIPAPTNLGASVGDVVYSGGTHLVNSSFRCKSITTNAIATVNIQGDVTILADELVDFGNGSQVILAPGAKLTVFVGKDFVLHNAAQVNVSSGDPTRMTIVGLGTLPLVFDNGGTYVGRVVAPLAQVNVGNAIRITGAILADKVNMYNDGRLIGAASALEGLPGMDVYATQRIDLDRLPWLDEDRTHQLSFYFANRMARGSYLRLETNMELLNVALVPESSERD